MFYISNITHKGQTSEKFENAKRVGELAEKLKKHLSWDLVGVYTTIDENKGKITIGISNKDKLITVLDEAETIIKELKEALNKIEEQA